MSWIFNRATHLNSTWGCTSFPFSIYINIYIDPFAYSLEVKPDWALISIWQDIFIMCYCDWLRCIKDMTWIMWLAEKMRIEIRQIHHHTLHYCTRYGCVLWFYEGEWRKYTSWTHHMHTWLERSYSSFTQVVLISTVPHCPLDLKRDGLWYPYVRIRSNYHMAAKASCTHWRRLYDGCRANCSWRLSIAYLSTHVCFLSQRLAPPIFHIKVCLQVLGSTKSRTRPSVDYMRLPLEPQKTSYIFYYMCSIPVNTL